MKTFLYYVSLLLFWACSYDTKPPVTPPNNDVSPPNQDTIVTINYLALGDSYTKGQSVPVNESFPYQLQDSLQQDSLLKINLRVIAQTGWTTKNLMDAIGNAHLQANYDFVTLLIGVNNFYQNKPIAQYQQEFPALLDSAIRLVGGDKSKVLVVSIPDYAYTPFGGGAAQISQGIDNYNNMNKMFALQYGIQYVNITDISRQGVTNPSLVANDGLHPSGKMYHLWVKRMFGQVKTIIAKK